MNVKEAVFADEFYIAGSLNSIKDCRDELTATNQNTVASQNLRNHI